MIIRFRATVLGDRQTNKTYFASQLGRIGT